MKRFDYSEVSFMNLYKEEFRKLFELRYLIFCAKQRFNSPKNPYLFVLNIVFRNQQNNCETLRFFGLKYFGIKLDVFSDLEEQENKKLLKRQSRYLEQNKDLPF